MGNPGTCFFSLASDTAFMTNLSNLTDDVKLRWKGSIEDTWQALESLAHDDTLKLPQSIAAPALKALREEEMQGLAAAICRPDAAVVAILNKCNPTKENWDLYDTYQSELKYTHIKNIK